MKTLREIYNSMKNWKEIEELLERQRIKAEEAERELKTLEEAYVLFKRYGINVDQSNYTAKHLELDSKYKKAVQEYNELKEYNKSHQNHCEHDMQYNWHDSHYEYWKCTKCGYVEKR